MFRHVVMFKWADDVDEAHVATVSARLDALVGEVDVIRRYHHGPDAGINDGNWDYVVVGDFDSADDYVTYRDDAAHQQLIRDVIAGRVAARAAVQFDLGDAG